MSHGKVVVTTPALVRAMPELVPDSNCLVAESGRQVVEQLDVLVANESLRRNLERGALNTYLSHFQPDLVFSKLLQLTVPKNEC